MAAGHLPKAVSDGRLGVPSTSKQNTEAASEAVSPSNAVLATRLRSLAQLLSAEGENPFKVRAYRKAADTIEAWPESVAESLAAGVDLTRLPGIGKGIAAAVREVVESGSLRQLETLRAQVDPPMAELSEFPGLDPKQVLRAYKKLGISSVAELKAKLENGELRNRLGARFANHVRDALVPRREWLLFDVDPIAESVRRYLLKGGSARRVEISGQVRRRVEVVDELSLLVVADDFTKVVNHLEHFGGRTERLELAPHRAAFRLPSGLPVTLEHTAAGRWGLALLLSTGSASHIAALETSRAGVGRLRSGNRRLATEAGVYRELGLVFVPPELREGQGEVERAAAGQLPCLVEMRDIRGDLHAHTTASDGAHSMEEMAEAAVERGYEYLGVTDHSQSLKIARGLSEADLWEQIRALDRLNRRLKKITLLKSAEVDILTDGRLDYSDALLSELDYTVCSVHSHFRLDRRKQTERILRAMDNPHFRILGHATGRLLLRRPGYEIDIERVVRHAQERGCFFEINSSPDRLDLSADHARLAAAAGVKIAVNTDAHSLQELDFIRCGVDQARRAGLSRAEILNSLGLSQLRRNLARR